MVKHSTDPTPAFAPTHDHMPTWKRLAAAATVGIAALSLVGCGQSERANPPAAASETPGAPASEAQSTPDADPAEHLGQDTEIAHDQLNMVEQETSIDDMLSMSDEDFAKLGTGDHAVFIDYVVQTLVPEGERPYNVGELSNDKISFINHTDTGVRGGGQIMNAMGQQIGSLIYGDANTARKLAIAQWYIPTDASGKIDPSVQVDMDRNAGVAAEDHIQVPVLTAGAETGWIKKGKEWIKVIYAVNDSEGIHQTSQYVYVTARTQDGREIFAYMHGRIGERNGGNQLQELADATIN